MAAKFWSSIFHKQPIERGVPDPLEADLERVRAGVQRATNELSDSVSALLDDLQRRQEARRKGGTHHV